MPRSVHIIGVPLDLGGGRRGVDMGPSAFRIAGLAERVAALGFIVADKGNIGVPVREIIEPRHERKRYIDEIASSCADLYASSLASLDAGALPIVLGGDRRRSQPRGRLGGRGGCVGAAREAVADRPHLGRRPR
jgi:arginase